MQSACSRAHRFTIRIVVPIFLLAILAGAAPAPAGAPAEPPPAPTPAVRAALAEPGPSTVASARGGLPAAARVSERLFGLAGLENVGRVAPGVFRGAQPQPEGYRTLKEMGIRTVVSLRSRHGEAKAVEAARMRSIELPMSTFDEVDVETIRKVVALMADPANQPVFVHCAHGQDRTGIVVAVYRMDVDGWTEADAEQEMQAFGFNDIWVQYKEFVQRYPAKPGRKAGAR